MTIFEKAVAALAVRPGLWWRLGTTGAKVLRARIDGQAYTAIAQTIGTSGPLSPALVKKYEAAACRIVLNWQALDVAICRTHSRMWSRNARP